MKFEWNKRYFTIAVYAFLTVAAGILFFFLILHFGAVTGVLGKIVGILMPILYGFVIAYLLNPVLRTMEKRFLPFVLRARLSKTKVRRVLAVILTYLLALAFLSVFAWIVVPQVAASIAGIGSNMKLYIQTVTNWFNELTSQQEHALLPPEANQRLLEGLKNLINLLYDTLSNSLPHLINFTTRVTTGVINVFVGIIVSVYMLMKKETFFAQMKKFLFAFFPKQGVEKLIAITHQSHATFSGFITGKIIDSFIIGILCFIGLTILRIPNTMLISVIVGVTNVIPFFGPFIGAIPGALIVFLESPIQALWVIIFIIVLQQFDGNILGPKILGKSTGMSAFWVIVSILLFGGLFGVPGMFIGVPTFAVIYGLVRQLMSYCLKKKGMSDSTHAYASQQHELLK